MTPTGPRPDEPPDGAAARDLDRRPPVRPSLPAPEPITWAPPAAKDALPYELPLVLPVDLSVEVQDAPPHASSNVPAPVPDSSSSSAPPPPVRRRRRFGWGVTTLLIVVGLLGLLFVLLELALAVAPSLLTRALRARGYELEIGGLDVGLLAGDVEVRDLVLRPRGGGEPLVRLDSLRADVRTRSLLQGDVVLTSLDVVGLAVRAERRADGSWDWSDLAATSSATPAAAPAPTAPTLPDFSSLRVDRVSVHGATLQVVDRTLATDTRLTADLTITNVGGDRAQPGLLDLSVAGTGLERARLTGRLDLREERADIRLALRIDRWLPAALRPLLEPLGLRPRDGVTLDATSELTLTLTRAADDGVAARLALTNTRVTQRQNHERRDAFHVALLSADVSRVASASLDVERVVLVDARLELDRADDGALGLFGLDLVGGTAVPAPVDSDAVPLALRLGGLHVHDVRAVLRDGRRGDDGQLEDLVVILDEARLQGLAVGAGATSDATLTLRARAPGVVESLRVDGSVRLAAGAGGSLTLDVQGATPASIGSLLAPLRLEPRLERGRLQVTLEVTGAPGSAAGGDVVLRDLRLTDSVTNPLAAPGRPGPRQQVELAALDRLAVTGLRLDGARLDVDRLELRGARAAMAHAPDGAVDAFGLRWPASAASVCSGAAAGASCARVAASTSAAPRTLDVVRVGRVSVGGVALTMADGGVAPASSFSVTEAGLELAGLEVRLDDQPSSVAPATLRAWLVAPGLADRLALEGTVVAAAAAPRLRARLTGDAVTLRGLTPELASLGITPRLQSGALELVVEARADRAANGELTAELSIPRLHLEDGGRVLADLSGVALRGLRATPAPTDAEETSADPDDAAPRDISAEAIDLGRIRLGVTLSRDGGIELLGLRFARAALTESAGEVAGATATSGDQDAGPARPDRGPGAVAVASARLERLELELVDQRRVAAGELPRTTLVTAALEVGALAFGGQPGAPSTSSFRLLLRAPGLVEEVSLTGDLDAGARSTEARLRGRVVGLTGERLREDLAAAGVTIEGPVGASFDLVTSLVQRDGVLALRADLSDLAVVDSTDAPAALVERVTLRARSGPGLLAVDELSVVRPQLHLARDAEGGYRFADLRFEPPTPAQLDAAPGSRSGPPPPVARIRPDAALAEQRAQATTQREADAPPAPVTGVTELGLIRLTGGRVVWTDALAPQGPVGLEATCEATLDGLTLGRPAGSARLSARLQVVGGLEALELAGVLTPEAAGVASGARLELDVRARGLSGGPLGAYLPDELSFEVASATARAHLDARVRYDAGGAVTVDAALEQVDYRDGERTLLAFERLAVEDARVTPELTRVAAVVATDIDLPFGISEEGAKHFLGLRLADQNILDVIAVGSSVDPKTEPPTAERAGPRGPPPEVRIERLDLRAKRFDLWRTGAETLAFRQVRLASKEPLRVGGPAAAEQPPLQVRLEASCAPVLSSVRIDLDLTPLALDPKIAVALAVDGLRGEALLKIAPELAPLVSDATLRDGRLRLHLGVSLRARRADPQDVQLLERRYGADLLVEGFELRDGDGPILVGLERLAADVTSLSPAGLHVHHLELDQPTLRVRRNERGAIHLAGFVFHGGTPLPPPGPPPPVDPEAPPPMFVVLDHVVLTGLDVLAIDQSVSPAFVLPLTNLDAHVTGISSNIDRAGRVMRLDALVRAGGVRLPRRDPALGERGGSIHEELRGIGENIVDLVTNRPEPATLDDRLLWELVRVEADVVLVPGPGGKSRPVGRARVQAVGVELAGFAGLAALGGVELREGVAGVDLRVRLPERGGLGVQLQLDLEDLAARADFGSAFLQALRVEAPLEELVARLTDNSGLTQVPPIVLELQPEQLPEGLSAQVLTDVVVPAVGFEAGVAVGKRLALHAGARIAQYFVHALSPLGLFMGSVRRPPVLPALRFRPGDTALRPVAQETLAAHASDLRGDDDVVLLVHTFGVEDLLVLRRRAGVETHDARGLVRLLEQERAALRRARDDAAAAARAALLAGRAALGEERSRGARALERRLGELERAIDEAARVAGGEPDHDVALRLRVLARLLAEARLTRAQAALERAGVRPEQIQVAPPRWDPDPRRHLGAVTLVLGVWGPDREPIVAETNPDEVEAASRGQARPK